MLKMNILVRTFLCHTWDTLKVYLKVKLLIQLMFIFSISKNNQSDYTHLQDHQQ